MGSGYVQKFFARDKSDPYGFSVSPLSRKVELFNSLFNLHSSFSNPQLVTSSPTEKFFFEEVILVTQYDHSTGEVFA